MKPIAQEDLFGCAVACVAFIIGTTYKKALKLFEHPEDRNLKGYYCRDIVKALDRAGKKYSYAYLKKNKKQVLKTPLYIVYLKKSKEYPSGHYLVRAKNRLWMNPWINFPKIRQAKSGFQTKLPGKPQWIIYLQEE
ncbi:MAG TPA: hypothetical protein VI977_00025 [archaeon]|nr:hypothetical protein [archaeon]